jgi:hypothetical protein
LCRKKNELSPTKKTPAIPVKTSENMFTRLTTLFFIIGSRLFIICGLILAVASKAQTQGAAAGDTFETHVGHGKVNIVDFRRSPNSGGLPLVFRLEYKTFESVPSDGFFGRITRGKMTFSLPRQNNPEMAYDKTASIAARLTQGPAFGDTVDYQAREIAPNVFEVHWKEPRGGDTVTHVEDFNRQELCTNITSINRVPIPAAFDSFDLDNRLDNPQLFPNGSPVTKGDFAFFSLCGTMSQSLASEKVWENKMHMLVYESPK